VNCQLILTRSWLTRVFHAAASLCNFARVGNSRPGEALPGEQADFNLGLIQPTAVFGRFVNSETVPK
jgi:hypothetical protein